MHNSQPSDYLGIDGHERKELSNLSAHPVNYLLNTRILLAQPWVGSRGGDQAFRDDMDKMY
jgi:hypothetical protein